MPALSRGVNPDYFVNTAFSFLNPKQTSWLSSAKNFPQLLTAWEARTVQGCKIWYHKIRYQDGADLHSCTALPVCDLLFMCRALQPSYEFCSMAGVLSYLQMPHMAPELSPGSPAAAYCRISVGAMAQDVSMLAFAQGSRMQVGNLEVYLLQQERFHMRMRIRLGMCHYYLVVNNYFIEIRLYKQKNS